MFLIYPLALEENLIFTRKWRPIITGIVNDKPCAPSAIVVIWSLWLHVDGRPSSVLPSLQPIWVLQVFSSQIKLTQSLRDHSAGFKWKLHFGVWFGNCVKLLGLLQFDRCIFFNFFFEILFSQPFASPLFVKGILCRVSRTIFKHSRAVWLFDHLGYKVALHGFHFHLSICFFNTFINFLQSFLSSVGLFAITN